VKGVIMAGGGGTRLRPLTCGRPKPMVPILNKPIMEYAILGLKEMGIIKIAVTLQYLPEAISDYFGDGEEWGVELSYFVEENPLGTAGSVKNAAQFLDEPFLVVSGDALTDMNLAQAVDFHRRQKALATQVLTRVDVPLEYGVVITDPEGRITRFLEKPSWGEVFSDAVNTGIYVLEPGVLDFIPANRAYDFSKDLFPRLLAEELPLFGIALQGYWCDVGDLDQYRRAHLDLLNGKVKLPGMKRDQIGLGTVISPQARIDEPVYIGKNCRIGPDARLGPGTVLGDNVVVREGASVKNSIVLKGCHLGAGAEIRGAVLGEQVQLANGARTFEGSVLGDGSRLASRATVAPGVKVWPNKLVAEGAALNQDLVWTGEQPGRFFMAGKVTGECGSEVSPGLAALLGAAWASGYDPQSRVAVTDDGSAAAKMLKNALISGVTSAGVNVADLGELTLPAHRLACARAKIPGVVIRCRQEQVYMVFGDERGIDLTPAAERKIENRLKTNDFRIAPIAEVGRVSPESHLAEAYLKWLVSLARDPGAVAQRGYRLVSGCQSPAAARYLTELADFFGWELLNQETSRQNLGRETGRQKADLGLWLNESGEEIYLVDASGHEINPGDWPLVWAYLNLEDGAQTFSVPVTVRPAAEILKSRYHAQMRVIKTAKSELLQEEGLAVQDGLALLVRLLDFLARRNTDLGNFLRSLPNFYRSEKVVECPWNHKGRVMRSLVEAEGETPVELVDGFSIRRESAWALVLPDPGAPLYRVLAAGYSQEAAEELTAFYQQRIQQIIGQAEP